MIVSETLPTLKGDRVALRALTDDDVPALFRIFSNPEVMQYWSRSPFVDESEAVSFLEEIRLGFRKKTFFQWGVARLEDDLVIGTCTLWQLDAANLRAEVGFVLGREHWRQGFMREALTLFLDFVFTELGLRRVEADVDPENVPSIGLLERLGFEREGFMRERWLVDGETADSVFFGLLESDWRVSGGAA